MRKIVPIERRTFIKKIASLGALSLLPPLSFDSFAKEKGMKMGLVTYLWGKDWDCPTIIKNCTAASIFGVELRV
jgi:hypothetical protein